ncbi:3258_t:CDS:2 [Paraglomus brasilianum]|uniref:3258_t:CDS:1 n=1 Tax=Paraglomus brasilianum TaxID=144538 RepID=A0A9N8W9E5_9GLOM|nr:3258_t:CDS:2 [Paraglomus brasilianum]
MFLKSTTSRLLALCALFAATLTSQAFPNGAGTCDVGGISSGHGPSKFTGTGGYAINVKPKDITKGNFDISLSGSKFEGILIYVVDANQKRFGTFTAPQGLQFKTCSGGPQTTLTHQDSNLKDPSKLVMSWSSGGSAQGNVTIQAVVVTTDQPSYYTLKQTFDLASGQGATGAFFANYTLFAVIIGIATFLYAFGAGMEALLRRQQRKAKQYAKDVTNGFAR